MPAMLSADYVIVGAGSAGCVLANRLSEDPSIRVLLLEAGGKDRSPNITIPLAFAKQFHTKLDWDYYTDPEPHCDNRRLYLPRGKSLGGSSSMNAMLYVRGRPIDYDLWEAQGATGWGWEGMRPYFLKAEHNERGASEHHAVGGPLNVSNPRAPRRLNATMLAAWEAQGIPYVDDYNGPEQDGCAMAQVTQKGGKRWSAANGYLRPVQDRPNLEVVTRAHVQGLELDGTRVTGVRLRRRGREVVARAEAEVILSAGAFGSPQILQLSGVGPADTLRAAGVTVRHDLPGVGENLQDHPFLTVNFEIAGHDTLYGAEKPKAMAEWLLRRSGKLTSTAAEAFAFVRSRPGLPAPDLQYHMGALYYEKHGAEEFEGDAAVMGPVLLTPKARGRVWLRSADASDAPHILTNTLSEPEDMAALVAGFELTREVAAREPLASAIVRELTPGPAVSSPEDVEASIRERVELIYHPVGTCRIGGDEQAVVDPELRVRGLDGVRVVDASVFPVIPGGNTNAPTIAVAERAADIVLGRLTAEGRPEAAAVA
jgi:choline dehydrogenase-like flavoprotein